MLDLFSKVGEYVFLFLLFGVPALAVVSYLVSAIIYCFILISNDYFSNKASNMRWFISDTLGEILFGIVMTVVGLGLVVMGFALLSLIHIAVGIVFVFGIIISAVCVIVNHFAYKRSNEREQ